MTTLPKTLSRWEQELSWLAPTLAPALGGLLPTLALAIGPLSRSNRNSGEPDGYGRIARRGPFDRMLASQWALLDEVPEDFLRRASSNELLFFELARSEPHGSERSIALFDAGPFSLGASRLAHLALLVVLARRAAEAEVPFFWSTLREPHLRPFVGEASVRALLQAHTPFRPTEATFTAWQEHLGLSSARARKSDDELFVIGDEGSVGEARASLGELAAAVIEDGLLAPRDQLNVTITGSRREPRRLVLSLPDEPTRVRLLRDPFRERAPPPPSPTAASARPAAVAWRAPLEVPIQPDGGVVFSRDGQKVLVRTATGIVAIALPEPHQSGRVLTRHSPRDHRIVAAGVAGRRVVTIAQRPRHAAPRGLDARAELGGELSVHELVGGARDLDSAQLASVVGFGPRLASLWLGVASPTPRPPDLVVRTRLGIRRWREHGHQEPPRFFAAHTVVPLGSGAGGIGLVLRAPRQSAFVASPIAGLSYEPDTGGSDLPVAVAPDDAKVRVAIGPASEGPLARASQLMAAPVLGFLGVVDILDLDGSDAAILTEHAEGPSLATILERAERDGARIDPIAAASVARDLAHAIERLAVLGHGPHLALSPSLVVMTTGGPRVDHGLRWPLDVTAPSLPENTAYFAPETAKGLEADFRADVYSVGLVLHEMIGGVHATGEQTLAGRVRAIVHGELLDLGQLRAGLAPELHAIVRTATATHPAQRFASPRELREALDAFLDGKEVAARELSQAFALEDLPTTRRLVSSAWELTRLQPQLGKSDVIPLGPAHGVVPGGTSGGAGLVGLLEPERVSVVTAGRVERRGVCPIPAGANVVGVCALDEVVVRRADSLEILNPRGVVAAFAVPIDAEIAMAPGWPQLAVLSPRGRLEVISLSQRRLILVGGASG